MSLSEKPRGGKYVEGEKNFYLSLTVSRFTWIHLSLF